MLRPRKSKQNNQKELVSAPSLPFDSLFSAQRPVTFATNDVFTLLKFEVCSLRPLSVLQKG
ncbi:Uncharacterised protein [Chlamydia abortus]|nr:Uncharacterised protein [Chlamydia abortus]